MNYKVIKVNLIISFSGREKGNCDSIADFISSPEDEILYFRNMSIHSCSNCEYECFHGLCKYRDDDIYGLYSKMTVYNRVILIVPMYCGNPCSLYFIFHERCQDYFMQNEERYEEIISRLYIVGVYGDREATPDFIPCFEKWYDGSGYKNHVLGIERHRLGQKMGDSVLDAEAVRGQLREFLQ